MRGTSWRWMRPVFLVIPDLAKPGCKFHFRFYLLCCASLFICVQICMHTRDMCDTADGYKAPAGWVHPYTRSATTMAGLKMTGLDTDVDGDGDTKTVSEIVSVHEAEVEVPRTKLVSLVLDMCSFIYSSGLVMNMDNYYTSPEVAVALAERKVYIQGTCRANRGGFPAAVHFGRTEAAKVDRGTHKSLLSLSKKNAPASAGTCSLPPK
jgi:hypothetical protein